MQIYEIHSLAYLRAEKKPTCARNMHVFQGFAWMERVAAKEVQTYTVGVSNFSLCSCWLLTRGGNALFLMNIQTRERKQDRLDWKRRTSHSDKCRVQSEASLNTNIHHQVRVSACCLLASMQLVYRYCGIFEQINMLVDNLCLFALLTLVMWISRKDPVVKLAHVMRDENFLSVWTHN